MLLLGAVAGLAMLGRDELALLVPLIVIPLALLAQVRWRTRSGAAPRWGPWPRSPSSPPGSGYNMSRFEKPTFISSGLGITLASANCDVTWSGTFEGYWSLQCGLHAPDRHPRRPVGAVGPGPVVRAALHPRPQGPPVAGGAGPPGARLRRLPSPVPGASSTTTSRRVPYHWALVGLGMYYALFALALGGTVVLRRRRVPVFPLWALGVAVVATVLISFGNTRYRTPFEVALALLAAVLLDAAWGRLARSGPAPDIVEGERPPA